MNTRSQILQQADGLINGERQDQYGTPQESFGTIAAMWNAYLQHETMLTPADVCHMMALLKIARLRNGPHHDSSADGIGYLAIGAELS